MENFSGVKDREENIGEYVLEALLSSKINSITDLNLSSNSSWFEHPDTEEERVVSVDLLAELITKQAGLQSLNLEWNFFYSNATYKILTRIANLAALNTLLLDKSLNFDANESVEKLADILQSAPHLKKCDIRQQQSDREVKVAVRYATDGEMGSIVISDKETEQEICSKETSKTEAGHEIDI